MNKKYFLSSALIMLVMITNPLLPMHIRFAQYAINAGIISGGTYGLLKLRARHKEFTLQDVPPHTQQWARNHLVHNNIPNADSIPLKIGDEWAVTGGRFITMDPYVAQGLENILTDAACDKDKDSSLALAKMILMHEAKHYQNGDAGKGCLFGGLTSALLLQKSNFAGFVIKLGLVGAANIGFMRHTEREADRFACERANNRLELEQYRDFFIRRHNAFESEFSASAEQDKYLLSYEYLFSDFGHPALGERENMAQSYVIEWDKKHQNSHKDAE